MASIVGGVGSLLLLNSGVEAKTKQVDLVPSTDTNKYMLRGGIVTCIDTATPVLLTPGVAEKVHCVFKCVDKDGNLKWETDFSSPVINKDFNVLSDDSCSISYSYKMED